MISFGLLITVANQQRFLSSEYEFNLLGSEYDLFKVVYVQSTFEIVDEDRDEKFVYLPSVEDYDSNAAFMNRLVCEATARSPDVDYWIHLNAGENFFPDATSFMNLLNQTIMDRSYPPTINDDLSPISPLSPILFSPPSSPPGIDVSNVVVVPRTISPLPLAASYSVCVFNRLDTMTAMRIRVIHKSVFSHYRYVGGFDAQLKPFNSSVHPPLSRVDNLQLREVMITVEDQTLIMTPDFDIVNFVESLNEVRSVDVRRRLLYQLTYYQYMRFCEQMYRGNVLQYDLMITNLLHAITLHIRTKRCAIAGTRTLMKGHITYSNVSQPSKPAENPNEPVKIQNIMLEPFDSTKVFTTAMYSTAEKHTVMDLLTECFDQYDPFIYDAVIMASDLFIEWYYDFMTRDDKECVRYATIKKDVELYRDVIVWMLVLMERKYLERFSSTKYSRIEHYYYLITLIDCLSPEPINVTTSVGNETIVLQENLPHYTKSLAHFPVIPPYTSHTFSGHRTRIYDYERWQLLTHHGFPDIGSLYSEIFLSCARNIPYFCNLSFYALRSHRNGIYLHMYYSLNNVHSLCNVIRNQLMLLNSDVSDNENQDDDEMDSDDSGHHSDDSNPKSVVDSVS